MALCLYIVSKSKVNKMKSKITVSILSLFIVFICNAQTMRFNVMRPSPVNVPDNIKNIAIIDRSVVENTGKNIIERGLTAEWLGKDELASRFALDGLINVLESSNRFGVVRTSKTLIKDASTKAFPEPFTWIDIETICREYKVEGVISLEIFDSDYIILTNMANVTVGFRLYDLATKTIIDERQLSREVFWGGNVNSIVGAINRLLEKDKAIKSISYDAGVLYGQRISPSWYSIERKYYRKAKGNRDLQMGARMMEVNDWKAAIEYLKKAVDSPKRKVQGRAAHDLAVTYEINGELATAKKWAQDAWGLYKNKDSKNYSFMLGQRIDEQAILEE
jgi:hypothetical protein